MADHPTVSPRLTRRRFVGLSAATLAAFAARRLHAQEAPIENPTVPDQATRDQFEWRHVATLLGEPSYEEGFEHFNYVNPDAPKGGEAKLGSYGSFDSFNLVVSRGEVADGVGLVVETLMTPALDEIDISAQYGLLADALKFPDDFSWVTYRLNGDARWHDGEPVTPEDVIWSLAQWKENNPLYTYYYANVVSAEKTADNEVTFIFDVAGNRELPHILGQLAILPKHWWEATNGSGQQRDVSRTTLEPILGSGPYRIGSFNAGRNCTFVRVEDYWGRDLNVNVGSNNFDRIGYEYYRDQTVMVQAVKAGQYDYRAENSATVWNTAYQEDIFPARRQGFVTLERIEDKSSGVMQAFVPNLRRPLFADPRVRRALDYAFDFETINRTVMYDTYFRIDSYFAGTELASSGLPQGRELEILEKYRDQLPPEVFTETYGNPVGGSDQVMRDNLREAVRLLGEAGWELKNRQMVNRETGQPMRIEMLLSSDSASRISLPYAKTLQRIGITMDQRLVETSTYIERLRNFDFDMTTAVWGQSLSPGNEQRNYWGSESADRPGSRNYAGIADPAIDALINEVIFAKTRDDLIAATRAMDRALLHGHYVIPQFFYPYDRLVIWDKFGRPDPLPEYSTGFPTVWWSDEQKVARIAGKPIDPGTMPTEAE